MGGGAWLFNVTVIGGRGPQLVQQQVSSLPGHMVAAAGQLSSPEQQRRRQQQEQPVWLYRRGSATVSPRLSLLSLTHTHSRTR